MKEAEVRIRNRLEDIPIAMSMLNRFGTENGLGPRTLHDLNVVLDEALNNIIAYGYEKAVEGDIKVRLEYRNDRIAILIEDRGRPFDPRQASEPNLAGSLRERKVGGLGVHFMRNLMDEVSYTRADDTNKLCLIKKFTT